MTQLKYLDPNQDDAKYSNDSVGAESKDSIRSQASFAIRSASDDTTPLSPAMESLYASTNISSIPPALGIPPSKNRQQPPRACIAPSYPKAYVRPKDITAKNSRTNDAPTLPRLLSELHVDYPGWSRSSSPPTVRPNSPTIVVLPAWSEDFSPSIRSRSPVTVLPTPPPAGNARRNHIGGGLRAPDEELISSVWGIPSNKPDDGWGVPANKPVNGGWKASAQNKWGRTDIDWRPWLYSPSPPPDLEGYPKCRPSGPHDRVPSYLKPAVRDTVRPKARRDQSVEDQTRWLTGERASKAYPPYPESVYGTDGYLSQSESEDIVYPPPSSVMGPPKNESWPFKEISTERIIPIFPSLISPVGHFLTLHNLLRCGPQKVDWRVTNNPGEFAYTNGSRVPSSTRTLPATQPPLTALRLVFERDVYQGTCIINAPNKGWYVNVGAVLEEVGAVFSKHITLEEWLDLDTESADPVHREHARRIKGMTGKGTSRGRVSAGEMSLPKSSNEYVPLKWGDTLDGRCYFGGMVAVDSDMFGQVTCMVKLVK